MEKEIEKAIRETLVIENKQSIKYAVKRILRLFSVSNRFSPEQMAEWFHNNYEEIVKEVGIWTTIELKW